jgi:replicative DNA helicase
MTIVNNRPGAEVEPWEGEPAPSLPNDIPAERFLLACLMSGPRFLVEEVAQVLESGDFYRPGHDQIFQAAVSLFAQNEPIDPVTIWNWLGENQAQRSIGGDRMYLHHLYDIPIVAQDAVSYARIIRRHSLLRQSISAAQSMAQNAGQPGADPSDVLTRWERVLRELSREVGADASRAPGPGINLAAQADALSADTVIPGCLGHEDRVVAVGLEGDGKTTLAYQMAYCLAAGIHPFTLQQIRPGRALLVDLENSRGHLANQLSWLGDLAAQQPNWDPERLWVWSRPQGVNLKDPRDVMSLADAIRQAKPDFVYAGPIYKMIEDEGEESAHAQVTRFWDRMREMHGFALWMEAHVPLHMFRGDRVMRPLGSGVYIRWPEFGFALTRHKKQAGTLTLDRFRGDRIKNRCWPESFSRASFGQWPWSARYADGTLELGHHPGQDQ